MDFNKLVNDSKAVVSQNNHSTQKEETNKSNIEILYPAKPGVLEFRLLPNNKSDSVQRLITRHKVPDSSNQWGSKKIICAKAHYNKDCPLCAAISNVQAVKGKKCDVFRKFGYKSRGMAYAIITKVDPEYPDVHVGDLVLLMYAKSVYNEISNQIVNNASNLEYIFNKNEGCTFILETKKAATGFPEYAVKLNIGFNGPVMAKARETQEEYDALLNSLPNLNETIVPSTEPEGLYNDVLAAADLVNVTYGCVSETVSTVNKTNGSTLGNVTPKAKTIDVVDTAPNWNATPTPVATQPSGWKAETTNEQFMGWGNAPTQPTPSSNELPPCFGQHQECNQCLLCPHELECCGG